MPLGPVPLVAYASRSSKSLAPHANSVRLKLLASRAPRVGGLRARAGT